MSLLDLHAVVGADRDGGLVIAVDGELDLESAPRLSEWITAALDAGEARVVVDLSGLSFVDSSGLRALHVSQRAAVQAGVPMVLRGVSRRTFDLLCLTGLDLVFTIER